MRKLTKFAAPALMAVAALGGAGSAMAQPYHGNRPTPMRAEAIRSQINELQRRVQNNDWRGRISEREARGLRNDIDRLRMQFRTYNRDGLNQQEMRFLRTRIDNIRTRLHIDRRDWDNRRW